MVDSNSPVPTVDSNSPVSMVDSDSQVLKKIISVCSLLVFSVVWDNILSMYLPFYSDLGFLSALFLGISIVLLFLAVWIESNFWKMLSIICIWFFVSLGLTLVYYYLLQQVQPFIPVLNDLVLFLLASLGFFVNLYLLKGKLIHFTLDDILESLHSPHYVARLSS